MSPPTGVVVSGASTGIGEATVALLARSGYTVFAGVRNDSDACRLREIDAKIRPIMLEVTEETSVDSAIREVVASGTRLLGVVSNAGIALGGPLELIPPSELRRQFDVNVVGALALAQTVLPHLASPGGRIVFVGSIAGRLAMPYIAPYSASKFALRALADALRIELSPARIFVSLIEAGSVNTPIWRKGRESRQRLEALLGARARPHYYRALERLMRTTEIQERAGMPPERVARAILHALTARRPRARYLLGSARAASILALLPLRLRDRLLRASQGFE